MNTTARYVSHEQRVAEYSYTSLECPWLTHHPTPSINGPGLVIDCRYENNDDDGNDGDDHGRDNDDDKDAYLETHSNERYHNLSPCTVVNVAKVNFTSYFIYNLTFIILYII